MRGGANKMFSIAKFEQLDVEHWFDCSGEGGGTLNQAQHSS